MTSISVEPPVLNPPLGTPSNEWANKTTSSLDPPSQETPQDTTPARPTGHSPGVTPSTELPGAFPDRVQGETSTDTTLGTTNLTAIVDTAKQYLPVYLGGNNTTTGTTEPDKDAEASKPDKGTNDSEHCGDVRASEHDIYHKASLPSQELRGALPHEHVGGVGSLPGASVEKSVALLPDEQGEWSEWNTFAGRNSPGYHTPSNVQGKATGPGQTVTQKATDLGVAAGIVKADLPPKETTPKESTEGVGKGYPETLTSGEIAGAKQAVGNIKLVDFDIKQARDTSMPSTEMQGQQPGERTGGVGSLPGPKDEQGVAVLPEERPIKATEMVPRQEHRKEHGELPDVPKEFAGASGVGVSGATDPLKRDTQSRHLPSEPVTTEPGVLGSEHGQPRDTSNGSENISGIQRSGGSEGSAEGQRKASLKEKISGGMKVVSGKLGHDKIKVEEGKKLMHGQSA